MSSCVDGEREGASAEISFERSEEAARDRECRRTRATSAAAAHQERLLRPSANSGKNSGKPLLDGGQGKKASTSRKGRLEKTAKTIKQTTANAPSGKSQKERLEEERQRRRVTVQMRREPK